MKSKFNQQTSEGIYTFTKAEVFEALAVWCEQKGIHLKDKQIVSFQPISDAPFFIELEFNGKKER